jgi:antitoxin (DNA-binding transcriptional repressor) of toxin-antitoxin stability system
MTRTVNLYQAEIQLSALVYAAASGEEIVLAKNGVAKVRLVPISPAALPREPSGLLNITYIAEDFDAPDPEVKKLFEGNT